MSGYKISFQINDQAFSIEESLGYMSQYTAWMSSLGELLIGPDRESLTNHPEIIDIAAPMGSNDASPTLLVCAIVEAGSESKAIEIANTCPLLACGATVEVSKC